ncbi:MAG: helix-turn-helix transcriptional regulator [Gordonibacter sp.]|nr:helix-turn-helix transcriptional regulator [Gordonibacter sp.]
MGDAKEEHETGDFWGLKLFASLKRPSNPPLFTSGYDLLGIVGFSLYLAWFFLVLAGATFGQSAFDRELAIGSAFLFLLGEAFGAIIVWFISGRVGDKCSISFCAVAAGLLTVASGVSLLLKVNSFAVLAIVWPMAGIGAVILLSLWGFFLARLNHASATLYPAISVLIMACILVSVYCLIRDEAIALIVVILPILSVAIFFVWAVHLWDINQFVCPRNSRPPDWKSLSHSAAAMVANSFLLGFVIYAVSAAGFLISTAIVLIAIVVAACFKIYDARNKRIFEVSMIIKVIAPTAAIGLLLLPFLNASGQFVLLAFVMLIAMIDEIICWSAVSEYMHVHQLMPFANMAYGRAGDIVGLLLGYICGLTIFGTFMTGEARYSLVIAFAVISFVALQAFFFKDNYTPFTEHRTMNADLDNAVDSGQKIMGRWKERCIRFSEYYQLTPRQQEVLLLLAKGYSTGTIEKVLVVSNYTVKAHVYGIYKKTGVHARQELIELLERFGNDAELPDRILEK